MDAKNIIFTLLLAGAVVPSLNAFDGTEIISEEYPLVNAYITQYKGNKNLEQIQELAHTKCFIDANNFIYNKKYQKNMKMLTGDPNILKSQGTKTVKVANYTEAVKKLSECVVQENNPLAAFEGLTIIKSFIGIDYKKNVQDYKRFSEILYNDKSCNGYVEYGEMFAKGIAVKPNKNKALKIYTEGKELCVDGWQKMILDIKINNLKYIK